jgi:hypothetical protein
MRFNQIASRLNGFSTPIFGLSWQPPTADRDVARRVLSKLESRRALFEDPHREVSDHLIASVLEIRAFLDEVLGQGGIADELSQPLRRMRKACLAFLAHVPDAPKTKRLVDVLRGRARWTDIGVAGVDALAEMRRVILHQIALIAIRYGLDVEEPLASQLPEELTHD